MEKIRLSPDVRCSLDQNVGVLFDGRRGRAYRINEVGVFLLKAIERNPAMNAAVLKLHETYETEGCDVREEVKNFFLELERKGLVETE